MEECHVCILCILLVRRSNLSTLKETSPGCSLEGLMLRLKLQYSGHLMRRGNSLQKPWCWVGLGAEGEGDVRGWDGWMASPTRWTWVWVNSGSLWWTGRPGMLQLMGSQRVGHDWATELNWDEHNCAIVWTFFGIAFLWDWNENWPFPVLWPLLSFPNLRAYWV